MARILTVFGEEYTVKTNLEGATLTIGLYNDSTDTIADGDDLAAITTEPSDGNYVRQSITVETVNSGGNWTARNTSSFSFDTTNTTGTVDSYFVVANFQSTEAGDGSATDHLIATGALSQSRDLSQIDTLNIPSGSVGYYLD